MNIWVVSTSGLSFSAWFMKRQCLSKPVVFPGGFLDVLLLALLILAFLFGVTIKSQDEIETEDQNSGEKGRRYAWTEKVGIQKPNMAVWSDTRCGGGRLI